MKKDLIFTPAMLIVGAALFMLKAPGMTAHIAVSVVGMFVLAVYTAATKKSWKIPALEIIMRAFYGIALVTGPIVMKIKGIVALQVAHKVAAILFIVLLAVVFVHKLIVNKTTKN